MADGIDVLIAAASAAKERRKQDMEFSAQSTDTFINTLQNNRRLGLMNRQVGVEEQTLGLKQQELMIEKMKADTQSRILDQFLSGGANNSNLPPGTTLSVGGLTLPVNQKLTESEQSAIAGSEKFEPLVKTIQDTIDKGVFNQKGVQRAWQQFLAEGGGDPIRRFLTEDNSKLEDLASAAAEMKKFAFAEGGKQLSPTEKKVVEAGLSFTGKSDDAIKRDFSAAIDIIRQKKILALGGAEAANKKESDNIDFKSQYNKLRAQGMSAVEAKKKLGLK